MRRARYIAIAAAAVVLGAAGLAIVMLLRLDPSPVSQVDLARGSYRLDHLKTGISVLGFAGTICALIFAVLQYSRAEQWKRAEFVASEMKKFFDQPKIALALTMCDWGERWMNLLGADVQGSTTRTLVTRELQCSALVPHTLEGLQPLRNRNAETDRDGGVREFSAEETIIRDVFDALLDGFERMGSFLASGLVSANDLRPYIGYWIDDIARATTDPRDATWCVCLFTYVEFYGYRNVQALFAAFGYDVKPEGRHYRDFAANAGNDELMKRLAAALRQGITTGQPAAD